MSRRKRAYSNSKYYYGLWCLCHSIGSYGRTADPVRAPAGIVAFNNTLTGGHPPDDNISVSSLFGHRARNTGRTLIIHNYTYYTNYFEYFQSRSPASPPQPTPRLVSRGGFLRVLLLRLQSTEAEIICPRFRYCLLLFLLPLPADRLKFSVFEFILSFFDAQNALCKISSYTSILYL